ncbi:MAG: protein kinase domain-containing protein [Candidatus Poseidoniales archaeon]|jgi:tRNA A-37 threonylcarbamoyl transferase component Bud32|tara:strand:+ start:2398 stop:4125 length:1728 start_codon:yes stop_codon:yes gene_type:complete
MEDGYHEINYPDGSRYEGEIINDEKYGQGIYKFPNETKYIGEWKNGKYHGQGIHTFADNSRYEGEFKEGKFNGQGIRNFSDNGRYEGNFIDGKKQGQGIYKFPDGAEYDGQWKADKFHGQGSRTFPDGGKYEGNWKDGVADGTGTYSFVDGGWYEGEWKYGKYHGKGIQTFADGARYEGLFKVSKRHGYGTYKSSDGNKKSGQWRSGSEFGKMEIIQSSNLEDNTSRGDSTRLKLGKFVRESNILRKVDKESTNVNTNSDFNSIKYAQIAKALGRTIEDIEADLADDGILNYSSGSDSKTKDGHIDPNKYHKLHHLQSDGGMAEIYTALDKDSGDEVIWKEASTKHLTAKEANKALVNEIDMLVKLDNPRIPKHINSGTIKNRSGQTVQVLIMEKIDGDSLDKEMKIFIRRKIKQPLGEIIKVITECCEALEYMADLNPPVYHRDIKPHNIMLDPKKGAVLIDFGLAKGVDAGAGLSTSGGMHTAGWAPPERERGNTGSSTDVYSLGQLLWHMLSNERAGIFSEDYRIEKIQGNGQPIWLADLINMAVIPDAPSKRIQSIFEFRTRLENFGRYNT